MDDTIQRNFAIPKATVDKLNRLNVWGRMGPSELTDVAIRLLYEVCKSVQQGTGMDAQTILRGVCNSLGDGEVSGATSLLGQLEPPVSQELSDIFTTITEVAKMINSANAQTTFETFQAADGGERQ